jgi:Fur family ferric uptake transcriptional regulator
MSESDPSIGLFVGRWRGGNLDMPFDVAEELRSVGLRATVPRMKVLAFFRDEQQRHFTADQQFVDAKILRSGTLYSTRIVYELNNGPDHDHAICMSCGKIEEFHDSAFDARQKEIGESVGFSIVGRQLVLHGYCHHCRAMAPKPTDEADRG